jgi:lysophospholipase L1-like esterase
MSDPAPPTLSRRGRILLAILLTLGAAGFVEAFAAIYWAYGVPPDLRASVDGMLGLADVGPNITLRYRPHPYFVLVNNPAYVNSEGVHLNQEPGIRAQDVVLDQRRPGSVRIVAIGGSTTYGYYEDDLAKVWTSLLQAELRRRIGADIEIVNAGVPTHTSFETLGVTSMWLPEWRPDVVLVHCGMNDAFEVAYPNEGGSDNAAFRHAWVPPRVSGLALFLMRHSHAARLAGMRWAGRGGFAVGDIAAVIQQPAPTARDVMALAPQATGHYFHRNIDTITTLIEHMGATPVLLTEPLNPAREHGQGTYPDAISAAVHRNNGIVADVAAAHGALLVDLYAGMRDPAYFVDACHETDEGMQAKAAALADALEPLVRKAVVAATTHPTTP